MCIQVALCQTTLVDFHSVKTEIDKEAELLREYRKISIPAGADTSKAVQDAAEKFMMKMEEFKLKTSFIALKLKGSVYPDFYFEDFNGKSYSLSEFKNQDVVLNFNYAFSDLLMNRVDSLIKYGKNKCRIIVLLFDKKENTAPLYERFGKSVLLAYLPSSTYHYYSLNTNFCFFLLDKQQTITDLVLYPEGDIKGFYQLLQEL